LNYTRDDAPAIMPGSQARDLAGCRAASAAP